MASLNLGMIVECPGCNTSTDTALARVRRQYPAYDPSGRIALGSMIDIWLSMDTTDLRPAIDTKDTTRYLNNNDDTQIGDH